MLELPHPHKPSADLSKFFVVTTISNPNMYKRRYELYWKFKSMCECAGVKLITVEQAFGHRQFMVTEPDNIMNVQVRTIEQLWHKENMLNIGFERARELGARELSWVDADCRPVGMPKEWFEDTWHSLQHYEFVQMWENFVDIDINNNPIGSPMKGFMANYLHSGCPSYEDFYKLCSHGRHHHHHHKHYPYKAPYPGAPGLAWAANVETGLDRVGRLMDFSILGSNDWYTAHALVGMLGTDTIGVPPGKYLDKMLQYQTLCERWIKRDVGYVKGLLVHDFHGRKQLRQYNTRDRILNDNLYDPDLDIKYDTQGLWQLETWEPRQIRLRDQIRAYFSHRNEDDTQGGW